MPTIIGPGGTNKNKNYEMFNIAEKFLGNNYGQGIPAAYYRTSLNERNKNLNYSIKNNNGKTAGFSFLKNFNNKERYLYLIAAKKGMGGILLKRIINNSRKAGLKTIALEPVENAIYFYLKHGFIHNNNKMILNLTKNHTSTIKRHESAAKLQRIYRARQSVKNKARERYKKAMREERCGSNLNLN